jgi:hypothetical protein
MVLLHEKDFFREELSVDPNFKVHLNFKLDLEVCPMKFGKKTRILMLPPDRFKTY